MADTEMGLVPWEEEETSTVPWDQPNPSDKPTTIPRQADPLVTNPQSQEEYESAGTGDKFLGVPVQKGVTDEGEPRTYLTPPNAKDTYKAPGIGPVLQASDTLFGEGATQRVISGGVLESIKAPLELGEYLAESVGLDPNDEKFIRENFPTMPANNEGEKLAQEVLSIVIGGATGAGIGASVGGRVVGPAVTNAAGAANQIGAKIGELLGPKGKPLVEPIVRIWTKLQGKDPTNAPKKFELFLKGLFAATGEIIGSSATTPSDVQPLSESLGVVPETDDNFVGNIVDNATFSAGLGILAKLFQKTAIPTLVSRSIQGFKKKKPEAETLKWFQAIDQDITPDLPSDEIARRLGILTDVIDKHSTFKQALVGGDIKVDTTVSMTMGAQDYVRRAYDFLEPQMGAQKFNEFVRSKADDFIAQISTIKQSLKDTNTVAKSDAGSMQTLRDQFTQGADQFASPAASNQVGQDIARPAVDDLLGAQEGIDMAKAGRDRVVGERLDTYDDNYLMGIFEDAKKKGSFSSNPLLANLTGEELFKAWKQAKGRVDQMFENIPPQDVDPNELAEVISNASSITNVMNDFGIPSTSGGMSAIDDVEELAKTLEGNGRNDVKTLIDEVRPRLSKRISAAKDTGDISAAEQLIALRDGIDTLINKSGDPDIKRAFDEYKKFSATWHDIAPLADYDTAARTVKDYGTGSLSGVENVYAAGEKAFEAARAPNGPGYVKKFIEAFQSELPTASDDVTTALMAEGLNVAVKAIEDGKAVDGNAMWAAMEPQLKTLDAINPEAALKIRESISELRQADAQLADKEQAIDNAKRVYSEVREEVNRTAAKFFIANMTGNGEIAVMKETGPGFKQIFDHKDAPNIVEQVLDKMLTSGDTLAVEGFQAELLRHLGDRYFTSKPIGLASEEGTATAVREASGAQLSKALTGNASNDIELIRTMFSDKPEVQEIMYDLMELGNLSLNIRGSKPNPFGSNTANDISLKQGIDTAVNMIIGPLNRTGTRAKNIGRLLSAGVDASRGQIVKEIWGQLSTNSDEAVKALTYLKKDKSGKTWPSFVRRFLDDTRRRVIRGYTVDFKGTDQNTAEQPSPDAQTNEAFNIDTYMDENKYYFDKDGFMRKQGLYSDPNQQQGN